MSTRSYGRIIPLVAGLLLPLGWVGLVDPDWAGDGSVDRAGTQVAHHPAVSVGIDPAHVLPLPREGAGSIHDDQGAAGAPGARGSEGVGSDAAVLAAAPAGAATDRAATEAAGDGERLPITPEDYGRWERLGSGVLSPDGEWLAAPIRRVDENRELRIHRVGSDSVVTVPQGIQPAFSSDGRWAGYLVGHSREDREAAEERGERLQRKAGFLDLESGREVELEGVSALEFSPDGRFAVLRGYPPEGGSGSRPADLVIRRLSDGVETNFGNVSEYAWADDDGALLAMVVDAEGRSGNGVRIYDAEQGTLRVLDSRRARYRGLAWRDESRDLAVLRAVGQEERSDSTHVVLAWRGAGSEDQEAFALDPDEVDAFPEGHRVVEQRSLRWAEDGNALFFGIARWEEDASEGDDVRADASGEEPDVEGHPEGADPDGEEAAAEDEEEDAPELEIWHAADVDPVPQQKIRATRDRERNHLAVWHLAEDRFVRLADGDLHDVTVAAGGALAVGRDDTPYDRDRMFGPAYQDVWLVDVATGERERVLERVEDRYFRGASPDGRYLLFFRDDHWWTYDTREGRTVRITEDVPATFVNLRNDHTVDQKPPHGRAGWTEDDEWVLLYDEYDIWKVDPRGGDWTRLTHGAEEEIQHRIAWVRPDQEPFDLSAPLYVRLYGEWTKRSGYARIVDGGEPEVLVWEDRYVARLRTADDAEVYAFVRESFEESPDYWVGGPDLRDAVRVTETNPFQSEYAWGRSELVDYENDWGDPLQAALFYPADYEPGRRYPMIVYHYERRSQVLHRYSVPSERDAYNPAVWTSRGYFVLQPDIVYRPRNPGRSAMAALVPAVETVLETGMVDPDAVGLIGHSWGGYQTTFAVTRTDRFAAAVAGAPLTNLISMYLSFYWNTGGTDARIFEISQGRMEVPWWEDYEAYRANSPVHHIEDMNTPLLMAFGTEDGAVDFNQGVEFYNAARRAGKPFVLLVYEGENHSLVRRPNQIDYHRRTLEWFDHYLKGEPAPRWIAEGVPWLEQEEKLQRGPAAGRRP